ncbi:hypothetical protein M501DRAFT_1032358 [Patellaria atrata CBS 101060]|uniref:Uncharacterized protein n=1 Tax=Patellaria atrata CBS 101060 TaxID=1346257 RepID=A0A9P4S983_9PEZI|nr:hypothetical protein M501DRAFT_1032358 [Patellaria atrata CBS 101060]
MISFVTIILATSVAAQSTVTQQIFMILADPQPLVGSIVDVDSTATTYAVSCDSSTATAIDPSDDIACGFPEPFTVTQGPSVFESVGAIVVADAATITTSVHCDLTGTTDAFCTASIGGDIPPTVQASFPTLTSTQLERSDITYLPVTISEGLEKLQAAETQTGDASAPTSSGAANQRTMAGAFVAAVGVVAAIV